LIATAGYFQPSPMFVRNAEAWQLATFIHFHPCVLFANKARSLPIEWSPVRGSTLVGSSLARK
jgi:hypothetical protein